MNYSTFELDSLVSIARMKQAVTALLSLDVRQTDINELTAEELALEAAWVEDLEPVLEDLYWHPLRNGIDELPEDTEDMRSWIRRQYEDNPAVVAALLLLLLLYLRRGADVGGQMGLSILGLDGTFRLTDTALLSELNDHAAMLTTAGTDMSLIDTTVNDLVRDVEAGRQSGSVAAYVAAAISVRVALRSGRIAETELARMVGQGQTWAYGRNGIARKSLRTREDDRVCEICQPLNGTVIPVNSTRITLPIHVGCRCIWEAVIAGWTAPNTIWTGG